MARYTYSKHELGLGEEFSFEETEAIFLALREGFCVSQGTPLPSLFNTVQSTRSFTDTGIAIYSRSTTDVNVYRFTHDSGLPDAHTRGRQITGRGKQFIRHSPMSPCVN